MVESAWNEITQFMKENNLKEPVATEGVRQPDEVVEQASNTGIRRLKGTIWWKLLKPARVIYNYTRITIRILKLYGVRALISQVKNKITSTRAWQRNFSKRYVASIMPSEKERKMQEETIFTKDVTFSILVPLYNTPENYLIEMIESVQKQTYGKWQLCLADGSDDAHGYVGEICKKMQAEDARICYEKLEKNMGISENTNYCIRMAAGNFISLFDHDDVLHPCALFEVMKAICEKDADFIYTDEATFLGEDLTDIVTYHFKPDFSPDNLLGNNYICHFTSFDKTLLDKTEWFRDKYDGSQDHDMILRLTDVASNVTHVAKLLYFWRSHPNSVSLDIGSKTYAIQAGKNAVHDFLESKGYDVEVSSSPAFPTIYRLKYPLKDEPLVSILIPNKDHVEDLALCIASIYEKTTYKNYEIVVVENNSTTDIIWKYYELIEKMPNIRVVEWKDEFNYSAINNFAAKHAEGQYYVLLNNDIEIRTSDWIQELLMYAQREDVGAVGAKLYFDNMTIQHGGIILGMGEHGIAGHSHVGESAGSVGYMGRMFYVQDLSAVTAAFLMISKEKWEKVGGMDEELAVAYNDVDFCLKLRAEGLLNVFTPFAEAIHYESKSRGSDKNKKARQRLESESLYMKNKWKDVLVKGDPFYNCNMSLVKPWKMR